MAFSGWMLRRPSLLPRVLAGGGGLLLFAPGTATDLVGLALVGAALGVSGILRRT